MVKPLPSYVPSMGKNSTTEHGESSNRSGSDRPQAGRMADTPAPVREPSAALEGLTPRASAADAGQAEGGPRSRIPLSRLSSPSSAAATDRGHISIFIEDSPPASPGFENRPTQLVSTNSAGSSQPLFTASAEPGGVRSAEAANDVIIEMPEYLRDLPKDIDRLFSLADYSSSLYELPEPLAALAKAHGLHGLKFPCQVSGMILTKMTTARELQARLNAFDEIPPNFIGSFNDRLMTGYRYWMIGCAAQNIALTASLLARGYQSPQTFSAIQLAGNVVPALIHGTLYKTVSTAQEIFGKLGRTDLNARSEQEGDWDLKGLVQSRIKQLHDEMLPDMGRFLLAFLSLLVANSLITNAG